MGSNTAFLFNHNASVSDPDWREVDWVCWKAPTVSNVHLYNPDTDQHDWSLIRVRAKKPYTYPDKITPKFDV